MSLTVIMGLTVTVACGFGHPLPLHTRFEVESSIPVNKPSWNHTANYTDVLHMNISDNKNKTEVFPSLGDSPWQTLGNDTDATSFMEIPGAVSFACRLSVCQSLKLADDLSKRGDEVAGDTSSALSPGK